MNKTFYLNSDFETKAVSSRKNLGLKIAGYANTTDKDRTGDIVTAQAWAKGVENYRKNPKRDYITIQSTIGKKMDSIYTLKIHFY